MISPTSLDVHAFYKQKLSADRTIFISVYTSNKGKETHMKVTTTGNNAGDFIIKPGEINSVTTFIKEVEVAFAKLVKVNEAFIDEQDT